MDGREDERTNERMDVTPPQLERLLQWSNTSLFLLLQEHILRYFLANWPPLFL